MNKVNFNRRYFIKGIGATAILWQIPFLQSCRQNTSNVKKILSQDQQKILHKVLTLIFPKTNQSPGIEQLHTEYHINVYLSDPLIDPDEQKYIINGIQWLNETAHELFKSDFVSLQKSQQSQTLQNIVKTSWGESWLSKLLTLTFESLLLDPLYQVNTGGSGWQWLHHRAGQPRPIREISYPEILERKKEKIIITGLDQL